MLNISPNSIQSSIDTEKYDVFKQTDLSPANRLFTRWLLVSFTIVFVILFFPWTQNIQNKGKVTTLYPSQRPQTIHTTIPGRIEEWYVREGQIVEKGDTIVYLSEIKSEYFDPELVRRTENQVLAKEGAVGAYALKVSALDKQIDAMRSELSFKQKQIDNKIQQTRLKLESQKAAVEQAEIDYDIAAFRYRRTDTLYQKGIKSLTDLEAKQLKRQEAQAKLITAKNKLLEADNALSIALLDQSTIANEYANKIAKAESDKFSTLSNRFDAEGSVNKLRVQYENYSRRNEFYFITAPQRGFITKAITPGIGETIKEGDAIVSVMPADYQLAVELFVKPMDLPLVQLGQEVSFIFDGWPAIVFSGWPDMSFGTYTGSVVAIDQMTNAEGEYRLLISPNDKEKPWPKALRVGSGAMGIALLGNVPLWYELWRQLNGFPPDYYEAKEDQIEEPKLKAPIKSVK